MPQKKRTSGLLFYNNLKKEVYAANKALKKPLSSQKVEKLIKSSLFPQYQGKVYSRIRKGDLREQIFKTLKSASRPKNKALLLYTKIVSVAWELNKDIPENQRLNIGEIRDVASKKLYPEISAIKGRKTLKIIRALAAKALKEEKKDICDVTAIPETTYQNIPYFNIDEYIAQQLPPCIYMELQAGKYGNTAIFNTKEYNYHGDGVASITNAINHARTIKEIVISDSGEAPEYQGSIQTRPGKKNDGSAENYYLSMLLHIDKVPQSDQPEDIIIPKKKKSKAITQKLKKVKKLQTARQKAHEEAKNLEKAPSPIKDLRKKIALKLANAKITAEQLRDTFKGKKALVGVLDAYKKNFIEQGKKLLKNEKKQGNINHRQYTELLSKIERAFDKKDTFATNKRGKNKGKG